MEQLYKLSASTIIEKIKSRALSVREILEAFIHRIEDVEPQINALEQFYPEKLLKEADSMDKMISANKAVGKLYGLPVSIKDTCKVKGFKISTGCPALLNKPEEKDATVVARIKSEGGIILGITNAPELLASYETDNLLFGRTNNPYDLSRTPGGSSGGEAALISAGGSPLGIGSDAGGSVRQPAHYSGICAHKPTQGSIPLTGTIPTDGIAGIITQIVSMGPMARHVDDLILMMNVIAGADGFDPHAPPVNFNNPDNVDISKLKIAYYFANGKTIPTDETVEAVKKVVSIFSDNGNVVKEHYPEPIKDIYRLHWQTFMQGGDKGAGIKQFFASLHHKNISPLLQQALSNSSKCEFSLMELRQRLVEVEQFRYAMMRYMQDYDIIVSPVAATPARQHGETHNHIHDFSYIIVHNLTGWPATVVPVAYSKTGLPIGVQIAAKPWCDHVALAVAKKLQDIIGIFPIPEINQAK
ncbi:MAG: amidase [Pseudomonadota bacterium]